jgi:prolyl-tRNA editing enzyme YbaK/EbsC (Cys-tRNA(Pro) deacylase)
VSGAIDRFLEAAKVLGHDVEVRRFPEGTKTADDAARAVGCDIGQIVKSLVFMADGRPVLALTSGANRVDTTKLALLSGAALARRANADEVRATTEFAIGGTPPFGHPRPISAFIDLDLFGYEEIWAAAGTPDSVFRTTPQELRAAAGAAPADFKERGTEG